MGNRTEAMINIENLESQARAHREAANRIRVLRINLWDLLTEEERDALANIAIRLDGEAEELWKQVREGKEKLLAAVAEAES